MSRVAQFPLAISCCCLATMCVFVPTSLWGQAGLRESLVRLDRDADGEIEPEEITPQARPYLERIAGRRLSLDRDNDIEDFLEAARIYHAFQNGIAGRDVTVRAASSIRSFEVAPDESLVPGFGMAELKYPYTPEDVEDANRSLRRSDDNDDGFIDREEARDAQWTHTDPFESDLDHDDQLSRMELIQRYARRRLMADDSQELAQRVRRVGHGIREPQTSQHKNDDSEWWRRGGSSHWLAASMLSRFDTNRNGRLEETEFQDLGIPSSRIDIDRNNELSRDELHEYLLQVQSEAGDESQGVPGWFYELDSDRDGQVAMSEFTDNWTEPKGHEFNQLDLNADGLLTAAEIAKSKSVIGGSFSNETAEPIPPRKTIISEIDIGEDVLIADLNVQVSITHSNTSYLDAFLTSPSGDRVELFSEVGGSGDHFDHTLFDDQAEIPINKGQPPFRGTFTTMALQKRLPSLGQFNGQSAHGVWQLVIRGTRNDRFGMLHGWSLIIRPKEAMLDAVAEQTIAAPASLSAPINNSPFTDPLSSPNSRTNALPQAKTALGPSTDAFKPNATWTQTSEFDRESSKKELRDQLKQRSPGDKLKNRLGLSNDEEPAKYRLEGDSKPSDSLAKESLKALNRDEKRQRKAEAVDREP
jgi:subtilisin-like proprotein convertase family protein